MRNRKKLLTALALLAVFSTTMQAGSWRINSNDKRHPHFADINAAMSSDRVSEGDTLYLDPGCLLTSTQNVTKRVTIIGTGYFLEAAIYMPANIQGTLYLKAQGCKIEGTNITGTTYVSASNVTIERCCTKDIMPSGTALYAVIRQCFVNDAHVGPKNTKNAGWNYWTVENCIIHHNAAYGCISDLSNATIRNNYLREGYAKTNTINRCDHCMISNNIMFNTGSTGQNYYEPVNSILKNNVFSRSADTNYPDNVFLDGKAVEQDLFALEGTNDQRYTLKEDSPAKGAATDGGDCGPYGGLYPYIPSGYPFGMPRFDSSSVGTRAVDGQVRVSQQVTIQNQ